MTEAFDFNISFHITYPFVWVPAAVLVFYLIFTYSEDKLFETLNSTIFMFIFTIFICYQFFVFVNNNSEQEDDIATKNKAVLLENGYESQAPLIKNGGFFYQNLEKCIDSNKDYVLTNKVFHILSDDILKDEVQTRPIYVFCQNDE